MNAPKSVGWRRVVLGPDPLDYELRRSARRTLAITVEPSGAVIVTAPTATSEEKVDAVVRHRGGWIRRQLREITTLPPPPTPREWVTGETHWYLGRQYRLKVVKGERRKVTLAGPFFRVVAPDAAGPAHVQRLMERWYLDHARVTFERRMAGVLRRTPRLECTVTPRLLIRKVRRRWGSCSPDGRILMNVDAVKLPVGCIDYLLTHELCHLRVPHHGPAFWRLLNACMPDWEHWRQRLEQVEV